MQVFLNGQILKEEDAKVSISDLSYQFGYGLFETIRCELGIPLFFESHYKRLTHSARDLGMPFPASLEEVKNWIKDTLSANKLKSARVKIIVSKKSDDKFNALVLAQEQEVLPNSFSLLVKKLSRDPSSVSFRHKTTSRADSYVSYKAALEAGFNDTLYLNEKNGIMECTRANIFLVMEDKIITPNLESGILSGVTREKIIEIAKNENVLIEEKNVHSLYLNKAKDVFITNAIIGLMPVSKVKLEDKELIFSPDSITIRLKNGYDALLGQYIKEHSSLTTVRG